ncbi:MAG: hypothetical protein Q8K79_15555 [Solirubrobacteraceae bacterium]|nr:hypothetical protein [Solirubrobacteraceae bacterium]
MIARALGLVGGAATILSAFLTWVTVTGLTVTLDLDLISADAGAGNRTVAGTDTALWPAIVAVGMLSAVLALLGAARIVLIGLGLLTTIAGGLLLAYMANVLELETRDGAELERAAARSLLDSSVGPGTPVLLAGGVLILLGGLAQRRAR